MKRRKVSAAMAFIILFGMVSMMSDVVHEGAASIHGAFLSLLGASAGTIGFVSGLGELTGYSLRYVFGRITDRTRSYWPMTIIGYALDIIAVPALALVGPHGWIAACVLLIVQKMGKAIKKPAKDTILSFAASQEGVGKSFAIQEMLDQIGAFLGPLLLYVVMLLKTSGSTYQIYSFCFAVLAIPGAITLILLLITRRNFPHPEKFEPEPKEYVPFLMRRQFILYIAGISLFAFGFVDYSMVAMHIARTWCVATNIFHQRHHIAFAVFGCYVD
jgi:MFS family permease